MVVTATYEGAQTAGGPISATDGENEELDIGNRGVLLEKVDKFCYLGDMLNAEGGCDSAVMARVRCAWKKFREYLPILTEKGFLLKLKDEVHTSCERSCSIYSSETWPIKVEHKAKLERNETNTLGWMRVFNLKARKKNMELRKLLGQVSGTSES